MVKKTSLFVLFLILILSSSLCATELEDIWKLCRMKSSDIKYAEFDLKSSEFNLKKDTDRNGNTYFGFDGTISFPRDYENGIKFTPIGYEESVTFRHNLNSSTSLELSLKNSLVNEYMYYREDKYQQTTSVSVNLSQSLSPYWLRGESKDPYTVKLQESVNLSKAEKEVTEKQVILNATSCYIKLRYYLRMAEFYRQAIEEYRNLINVLEGLGDDISYSFRQEISDFRNSLWNYVLSLSDIEKNLESQKKVLSDICGSEINIVLIEVMPDSSEKILDYDPDENRLDSKINIAKLERSLNAQSKSAVLSLSAGVTNKSEVSSFRDFKDGLSEDKNWNWYVNVSFDLSSLFSSSRALSDNEYKVTIERLKLEKEQAEVQKENERNQYQSLLLKAKDRLKTAEDMLSDCNEKKLQAEQMYADDALSEISLKQYTLSCIQMKSAYDSIRDEIWLYEWILENII